jgi:glycosyltransferase involved in cell wall biosynthesis
MSKSRSSLNAQRSQQMGALLSIIIPAHNEEVYIAKCLHALLEQDFDVGPLEVLLLANACTDRTADVAVSLKPEFAARGWKLRVLRTPVPGKLNALNCADRAATGAVRAYLDADVICDPDIMKQLYAILNTEDPLYASGTFQLMPARTWISRRYGDFWMQLPFMRSPAVGAGLFAVNLAGRARWGVFPDIISDDTFVRLQFRPDERKQVPACYHWPLVEGFSNLVWVRKRQDAGVAELRALHPDVFANEAKPKINLPRLFLAKPVSFLIYAIISIAVRLSKTDKKWTRGR